MKEKKKGVSVLRWPWNLLLSVALALVLGYFIGYLWSCLLGIALLGWLRRQDPDMPPCALLWESAFWSTAG